MKKIFCTLAFLSFVFLNAQKDQQTFQDLKQLEGKWTGTLNLSNGESKPINLEYSIRSNGSALLEESNEGGIEMMSIINIHKGKILSTHYCGAKNRPVAELKSNKNGMFNDCSCLVHNDYTFSCLEVSTVSILLCSHPHALAPARDRLRSTHIC